MKYMGSKNRIAKHLIPIMVAEADKIGITTWVEPFCLSGDTTIFTEQGVKNLKDVSVGEYIYSDNGTLSKVVNKVKSVKTSGLKFKVKGGVNISTTHEHLFYLKDGTEIMASNLLVDDELLTGSNNISENIIIDMADFITKKSDKIGSRGGKAFDDSVKLYRNAKEIKRFIKVDEDFCWALGLVVAEGSSGCITLHRDEIDYANRFLNIYKKITGLSFKNENCFYFKDDVKSLQVAVPSKTIYERIFFTATKIGYGARNKNISIGFKLSKNNLLNLIDGMHNGDRCVRNKGLYYSWNYKTSSKTLAKQLQCLLMTKLGIKSTISYGNNKLRYIDSRELPETDYYNVSVSHSANVEKLTNLKIGVKHEKIGGFVISDIESVDGDFYDIALEHGTSHKFIIDGGIVTHNCGGANLIDKVPTRFKRIGYDISEHVIMALIGIRDNVDSLPESVSEDYYKSLKGTPPTSITSWIRFVCSFGGKFENGYAREKGSDSTTFVGYGKRNAQKQSPNIQGVEFIHDSYKNLTFENSLVYCDIPYKSTTSYKTSPFDYEHFYQWCVEQYVKGNIVFISEYEMPKQLEYNGKVYKFECVWQGEIKTNFASNRKQATHNAVEKLFKVVECE